jgi:serine/threonine protein phosphatase PrpC/uncharacterized FlaG/YvyC family protein
MGELSVEEVEELLQTQPPGTFMIHFLDSKLSVFLMCSFVKRPNLVKHYLLQKVHSGYVVSKYKPSEDNETGEGLLSTSFSSSATTPPSTTTPNTNTTTTTTNNNNNNNTNTNTNANKIPSSVSLSKEKSTQFYSSLQDFIKANRHHLRYNYSSDGVPTLRVQRVSSSGGEVSGATTPTASSTSTSTSNSTPPVSGGGSTTQSLPYNPFLTSTTNLDAIIAATSQSQSNAVPLSVELTGSEVPSEGVRRLYSDIVCAQSVATYPRDSLGCQIICDWFKVRLFPRMNRAILAIADGCNWGMRPREAAQRACHAFVEFLSQPHIQSQIRDTQDCKHFLLRALSKAHDKILEGKSDPFDAGTTTLLGGMIIKINEQDYDFDEWAFVCVSVGDCKAFVWNPNTQTVVDITHGNRNPNQEITDCGGRLGPHLRGGLPDLRNLACYFWPCKEGDVLLLVTDGVHDNFNPQVLGKLPSDVGLVVPNNEWKNVDPEEANRIKTRFQLDTLAAVLNRNKEKTPFFFTHSLIQHCFKITHKVRDYMEKNPTKAEPSDHSEYPGKMDHTTCIAYRVGPLSSDTSSTTLSSSSGVGVGVGAGNAVTVVSTTSTSPTSPPSSTNESSSKKERIKRLGAAALRMLGKRDKSHKKAVSESSSSNANAANSATLTVTNEPKKNTVLQNFSPVITTPHLDAIVQLFELKLIELTHVLPKLPVRKYNVNVMRFLSSVADKGMSPSFPASTSFLFDFFVCS